MYVMIYSRLHLVHVISVVRNFIVDSERVH